MKMLRHIFALYLVALFTTPVFAEPLRVVTTTTDLAWLTKQIGGSEVEVTSRHRIYVVRIFFATQQRSDLDFVATNLFS